MAMVFKYELLNILRSRWIFFYLAFLLFTSTAFLYISGDYSKALVTVSSVITVLIPLTCILFSSFYWYNSERLTELLLTLPLSRSSVVVARLLALFSSLGLGFVTGTILPFAVRGELNLSLLTVLFSGLFLVFVFCGLGVLIGIYVQDKMRGVGLSFGLWLFFVLIHDSLTLLLLILFKDFPMDMPAAVLTAVNPIGLTRVVLLVQQEASMLLGHSGALVREILTGIQGIIYAIFIAMIWVLLPGFMLIRAFKKRDL